MKAMILAAGVGSRLDPLTRSVPKPMAPIVNKPVMEHIVHLLAKHGFDEVICNTHHLAAHIEDYFAKTPAAELGAQVSFNREAKLMGTAGGLKRVAQERDFFNDSGTFLVSGGDDLTSLDLTAMLRQHRDSGALATIALTRVDDPSQFGVVVLNDDNSIERFVEKPAPGTEPSNLVNTGVYLFEPAVFDLIPAEQFYDFGKELFPLLLEKGAPFYGFESDDYWRDVGNLREYRDCHDDFFTGDIALNIGLKANADGNFIGDGCSIDTSAKLEAPVVIGANTQIGANAVVSKMSVIGENCVVGANATIVHSILWDGAKIGDNTHLERSIVGYNAEISSSAGVFDAVIVPI